MKMTKGERLVAEMLGDIPQTGMPVLTEEHPFLRKVIAFMKTRKEWLGTATDLLTAIGDNYTPPNTVTKLLRKYDYQYLYKEKGIDVSFRRTNRKRLIGLCNRFFPVVTVPCTVTVTVIFRDRSNQKRKLYTCPQV